VSNGTRGIGLYPIITGNTGTSEPTRCLLSWNSSSPTTPGLKRKGFQIYTLKGKVAVDNICRYECLEEELEEVRQHLGLPEPLELPKAKSGIRKDKRHYSDVLSEAEKDRIAELFKDEIELMGYKF